DTLTQFTSMTFENYIRHFEEIVNHPEKFPLYQDENYYNYVKLNWSRTNRWLKKFVPSDEVKQAIADIKEPQQWILITEPWCGDAAHSVPQIYNMVKDNANITLDIQLRDEEPFLINSYLTNGGKSIPKLVIRNSKGEDLAVWGPRPDKLQHMFLELKEKNASMDEIKEVIQKWYNEDKGQEIQRELVQLLRQ